MSILGMCGEASAHKKPKVMSLASSMEAQAASADKLVRWPWIHVVRGGGEGGEGVGGGVWRGRR